MIANEPISFADQQAFNFTPTADRIEFGKQFGMQRGENPCLRTLRGNTENDLWVDWRSHQCLQVFTNVVACIFWWRARRRQPQRQQFPFICDISVHMHNQAVTIGQGHIADGHLAILLTPPQHSLPSSAQGPRITRVFRNGRLDLCADVIVSPNEQPNESVQNNVVSLPLSNKADAL